MIVRITNSPKFFFSTTRSRNTRAARAARLEANAEWRGRRLTVSSAVPVEAGLVPISPATPCR